MGRLLIDANLLVLLIVGSVSRTLIPGHKALGNYTVSDYELLTEFMQLGFTDFVVLPSILTEVSNLAPQGCYPEARRLIRSALARFIDACVEQHVPSSMAARHNVFAELGLTDAAILVTCGSDDGRITLLTADDDLAIVAEMAG